MISLNSPRLWIIANRRHRGRVSFLRYLRYAWINDERRQCFYLFSPCLSSVLSPRHALVAFHFPPLLSSIIRSFYLIPLSINSLNNLAFEIFLTFRNPINANHMYACSSVNEKFIVGTLKDVSIEMRIKATQQASKLLCVVKVFHIYIGAQCQEI